MHYQSHRAFIAGGVVVAILGIAVFIAHFDTANERLVERQHATALAAKQEEGADAQEHPFADLSLEARSAYVFDIANDAVLYQKNANTQLPLASITKLMTAYVAHEAVPPSTVVRIGASDVAVDGDSGLLVGERWHVEELTDYTLITSSNDGASALARTIGASDARVYASSTAAKRAFVRRMNRKAQELGLSDTRFENVTGLDVNDDESGAYGTAKDVGTLLAHLVTEAPEVVEASAHVERRIASANGMEHPAVNTNRAAPRIPGVIASKTGYTDLAGGNLAMAVDVGIGHPVVAVVLGSTFEGRFEDMRVLVEAIRKHFEQPDSRSKAE